MKTYSRKRDRGSFSSLSSSSDNLTDSPSSSQSSAVSDTASPPSSQTSQQSSSQPLQQSSQPSSASQTTLSSSPPSTPTKKAKVDWWKTKPAPEDNKKKSTPTKKGSITTTPQKKKEQMFLDFGQKNFDAKLCPECGMMYAPGVPEDNIMHNKFHAKHESIINFPQWKSCKIVKEFPLGGAVICVGKDDTNANQKKVSKVRKMMDKELGYIDSGNPNSIESNQKIYLYISTKSKVVGCVVAEEIDEAYPVIIKDHKLKQETTTDTSTTTTASTSTSTPTKSSKSSQSPQSPQASQPSQPSPSPKKPQKPLDPTETSDDLDALFEKTDGDCKPNKTNRKAKKPTADEAKQTQTGTPSKKSKVEEAFLKNFSVSCSKEPQKAVCGISRIWTSRTHRRQGIASRMLDAVRSSMIYGYSIPRELCAFSQPTADGKLFFESYRGTKEFLVYL